MRLEKNHIIDQSVHSYSKNNHGGSFTGDYGPESPDNSDQDQIFIFLISIKESLQQTPGPLLANPNDICMTNVTFWFYCFCFSGKK